MEERKALNLVVMVSNNMVSGVLMGALEELAVNEEVELA